MAEQTELVEQFLGSVHHVFHRIQVAVGGRHRRGSGVGELELTRLVPQDLEQRCHTIDGRSWPIGAGRADLSVRQPDRCATAIAFDREAAGLGCPGQKPQDIGNGEAVERALE